MQFSGTFKPHPKGFGFVQAVEGPSIFVPPKLARRFFYFDTVQVEAVQDESARWSAQSLTLLEPGARRIAGTVEHHDNAFWVVPELPVLPRFAVYAQNTMKINPGDKVVAEALGTSAGWVMEIRDNVGPATTKNWESELSMKLYAIPNDPWLAPPPMPVINDYANMEHLAMVTIDSESTTDVDDAVFVQEKDNGFVLHVAIADASAYVVEGSDLDAYAFERATTVYMTQRVIPMLPRSISSNAGSLLPGKTRPVILVSLDISDQGLIQETNVQKATIRSRAKLSYDEVTKAVEQRSLAEPHAHQSTIDAMHRLYLVLLEKRVSRGSVPIRSGDYDYKLDSDGRPASIVFSPWQISDGMVEECMLAANTAVAQWLIEKGVPCLYRHHTGPDNVAWETKRSYFEALGLGTVEDKPSAIVLQKLLDDASGIGEEFGVSNAIRSMMRPATYQVDEPSHYSLAYECYTHFTSPLRRLADLTVHRVIKRVLDELPLYTVEELQPIADQCTAADKRSKKASREEAKRLHVQFAAQWVGQVVPMQVTGGNSAGWFLKSENPPIETFTVVPPKAGWIWDPLTQRAAHETHGSIRMGDILEVSIDAVDMNKVRLQTRPLCVQVPEMRTEDTPSL